MRHTRTVRLTETEEKVIEAAAMLAEVGTSVFLRAAGLTAAKEVVFRSGESLRPENAAGGE